MKKKAYVKNQFRTIFNTKARFLSIFCIVFLGAAFFSGLRHTPLIMEESIDHYLRKYNFNDLNYVATLGFDDEDIEAIKEIAEVDQVESGYRFDALIRFSENVKGVTVYSNDSFDNQVNKVELVAGNKPKKENECLVDNHLALRNGLKVGDQVVLSNDNGSKEFTVTGLINDSRFISSTERGTNSLGDGTNEGFVLIYSSGNESLALPQELYDLRGKVVFNEIRISLKNENDYGYFSDDYLDYVKSVNKKVKKLLNGRIDDLNEQLVNDAKAQLADGEAEYNDGVAKYQDGLNQYNEGVKQYEQGLQEYQNGLVQYNDGYSQYQTGLAKYQDGLKQYEAGYNEYLEGKKQYEAGLASYNSQYSEYTNYQNQLSVANDNYALLQQQYEAAINQGIPEEQLTKLKEQMAFLQTSIGQLQYAISQYEANLVPAKRVLDQTASKLENARITLENTKATLDNTKTVFDQTAKTLRTSKQELDSAKVTLDETKVLLDQTKVDLDQAEIDLQTGKEELDEARQAIEDIPSGELYTLTCNENAGYVSFTSASASIDAIATIFPLIFFLVAALVSMTTMTRMVEEQRVQSGTYRALGYHRYDIVNQYIIYAFLATFVASILGIIGGVYFFPGIIYYLYRKMLFSVGAPLQIIFDAFISIQTFIISVAVILLVTYFVARKEVSEMPASLLRPKAPKMGKRILLERISFLWKRMSFNQKVTMRNIFRYKKRFFMSIIGIAGCTSLIVTGFGIRNSVSTLADKQYGEIYTYDGLVIFNNDLTADELHQEIDRFASLKEIKASSSFNRQSVTINGDKDYYGTLEVFKNDQELSKFINLEDYQSHEEISLEDDGVVISAKLSELLDVTVGDKIKITLGDHDYQVKVTGLMTLYFQHQLYMSEKFYQQLTNETVEDNYVYFELDQSDQEDDVNSYCKQNDKISSVNYTAGISQNFRDQMVSIDSVVIILIACAGALAFIVLYNLTNINIQERKSEIATIKVLGFYPREVYDYVFRENTILSIIGSVVGLGLGKLLHLFIIYTVEVELAMFIRTVNLMSYVYAVVFTLLFTYLIDFGMRRVLKKIDMVESLKSIE